MFWYCSDVHVLTARPPKPGLYWQISARQPTAMPSLTASLLLKGAGPVGFLLNLAVGSSTVENVPVRWPGVPCFEPGGYLLGSERIWKSSTHARFLGCNGVVLSE